MPAGLAAATLGLLATRAVRADGVAVLALAVAVAAGLVPAERALAGFSDPVVVTIAALVVLAASVHRSGLVDAPRGVLIRRWRLTTPVLIGSGVLVALLAAFSGRVGTRTALLQSSRLPEGAAGASRPVLMLNLACLAGGVMTVVGGVPNLLVSSIRAEWLGAPFAVLAFLPAGALLLSTGLLLFAVISVATRQGAAARGATTVDQLRRVRSFTAEAVLPPGSPFAGRTVAALEAAEEHGFRVSALIREGFRRVEARPEWVIEPNDVLVLDCQPADLHRLLEHHGLQPADGPAMRPSASSGITMVEAVVTQSSALIGQTPPEGPLDGLAGVHLFGIGRNEDHARSRLRRTRLRNGDILVLATETDTAPQTLSALGCLPLTERRLRLGRRRLAAVPLVVMAAALLLAALGLVPLWLALLGGVLAMVLSGQLTVQEAYERVPWPGLLMLAALLPLANALHDGPAPAVVVGWLVPLVGAAGPLLTTGVTLAVAIAGALLFGSAVAVLLLAPFAIGLAAAAGSSADMLLMAVAVGASIDMLDGRGMIATVVPAPGRRMIPFWPAGALATVLLLLCGTASIRWVWGP